MIVNLSGHHSNPGIEPRSLALQVDSLLSHQGSPIEEHMSNFTFFDSFQNALVICPCICKMCQGNTPIIVQGHRRVSFFLCEFF